MSCLTQSCRAGIRSMEVRQDVVRRFTRRMDQEWDLARHFICYFISPTIFIYYEFKVCIESHVPWNTLWSIRMSSNGTNFCLLIAWWINQLHFLALICSTIVYSLGPTRRSLVREVAHRGSETGESVNWKKLQKGAEGSSRNIEICFNATCSWWIALHVWFRVTYQCRSGSAAHVWPSFLVHFWWVTRRAEVLRDFMMETRRDIKCNF